jgi:hypothetical protein
MSPGPALCHPMYHAMFVIASLASFHKFQFACLQKMDTEDRPTGCLLCPKHGDITIDYKVHGTTFRH